MDGLIHVTDLSWERVNHPSEMFSIGEQIEVIVTKYDKENNRISLGLKQLTKDPWENVESLYKVGSKVKSSISSIADYGAFIELEKGVEGLIHTSEMSWVNKNINPNAILKVGEEVEVVILEIDNSNKTVTCVIKKINEDKIFIVFDDDLNGVIKKSNLAKVKTEQNTGRFAVGEKIDAKVLKKISKDGSYELSVKDLEIQEEKEALKEYGSSSSGASIGDIIGAALEEGKKKNSKSSDEKK